MKLDPAQIKAKVEGGLSPVCATCHHYWKAREHGLAGDRCLAVDGCCGPIRGGTFHEYLGPLPNLRSWCFVCSKTSTHVVQVNDDTEHLIGVCEDHIPMLWEPRGDPPPQLYIRASEGDFVPVEKLKPAPKKTLRNLMKEVDEHRKGGGTF